jgi:hypothetical protein
LILFIGHAFRLLPILLSKAFAYQVTDLNDLPRRLELFIV